MKIELEDDDIARIADAVVKKFKDEGGKVETKTGDKPKDEGKAASTGKAKGPKREDVLAKVRELGAAKGKDVAKEIIGHFGSAFGEVKDADLGKLLKEVEDKLAEEAADDF